MLVRNLEDFQKFVPASATFEFDEVKDYLEQVEDNELIPLFSDALITDLKTKQENNPSEKEEKLIRYLQRAEANIALFRALPFLQVAMSDRGIQIESDNNRKTAFAWQIENIEDTLTKTGNEAIENALSYLEINADDFEEWKDSDAHIKSKELFINSATVFDEFYGIGKRRQTYLTLLPEIKRGEKVIRHTIGATLFDRLKTANDLTGEEKEVIELSKAYIAPKAIASGTIKLTVVLLDSIYSFFSNSSAVVKNKKPLTHDQRHELIDNAKNQSEDALTELKDYLINTFPEEYTTTENSNIGWATGGDKAVIL